MPNVWISVGFDHYNEAEFKLQDPISADDPTDRVLQLIDRAAEDAKRWVRAQRGKLVEDD